MFKFKLIIALALISAISCDNQFAENLKNAKPISEHPRYQEHQLRKNFPKDLNNNVEISPFIVGGQPADLGQFPHHALIFIVYPNIGMYLCGGSVIDRNWILTAGHCVYGGAEYFEIYLGVVSMLGPAKWGARIYPNDTILHSEYDDNTLNNDIAMIKLANAPEDLFFDPSIAPIAIPSEQVDLLDRNGTVIGFGRFSDNSTSVSENLKFTTLKTISNEQCALVFVPGVVRDTNFCAETNAQSSTCGGDSGGSYIFNINGLDRLEGITSFGAQIGCQLGYPVGFTRVTSYLDWIYYNINGGTTPPPDTDSIWRRILQIIIEILKKIFGRN